MPNSGMILIRSVVCLLGLLLVSKLFHHMPNSDNCILILILIHLILLQVKDGSCQSSTTGASSVVNNNNTIKDVFDLDEWQTKPELFGNTIFGLLGNSPLERMTIQKLLTLYSKGTSKEFDALYFTKQVCTS